MRRFTNVAGLIDGTKLSTWLRAASVAALTFLAPAVTHADPGRDESGNRSYRYRDFDRGGDWRDRDHGYGRGYERDDRYGRDDRYHRDRGGFNLDIRVGEPHPRYVTRAVRVWVPPVFRTECERVWVPDVYEDRVVTWFAKGEWHSRLRPVLVRPGHYEERQRRVLVREGYYETRYERVKVAAADTGFRLRY